MSFPYKHFLLIGATSGIGRAMAQRLIENGAKVTAVGRRQDRLDEFVSKFGSDKASAMVFDITKTDEIPRFVKDVTESHPDIDSIFLNAGFQRAYNLSEEGWLENFNNEIHTNLNSIVALVHGFMPFMKRRAEETPASFIITGTNLSVIPGSFAPGYSASKGALGVFTLCLREHLKEKSKLKVIEIMPPAVQTELHDYMGSHGAKVGMPLQQFIDQAFDGLQQGLDQVVVRSPEGREMFDDVLEKRRKGFEILAENGKTTLILNLLPQLPKDYKLALLKNEFGDVAIDSQLASTSAITGVRELLNGCICCNLVGQLSDALSDLRATVNPDRIIIETSGSAFPATLAMEVNRLSRESVTESNPQGEYVLDGVVSVIDVENWGGYEDTSYTAKLQARYTDLIVFNKWEGVGERRFDEVLDRVGDLGVDTAWVKSDRGTVERGVLLGIDGALVAKGGLEGEVDGHVHDHDHEHSHGHQSEVEVLSLTLRQAEGSGTGTVDVAALEKLLSTASKEEVYRIKGIVRCSTSSPPATSSDDLDARPAGESGSNGTGTGYWILNWAFGRWTCTASQAVAEAADPAVIARITLILARYESGKWKKRLEAGELVKSEGAGAELSVERLV
ncbi:hypothetical protein BJX61DRAFT_535731 [Aspergillus egyptiacus]|nr:hypothetical protein BJX61DRAFT_535731 [Aspergillus egyptiacus]